MGDGRQDKQQRCLDDVHVRGAVESEAWPHAEELAWRLESEPKRFIAGIAALTRNPFIETHS